MDSLTHIVLGGCIGDALARKKIGKKAMIYGALANSLPDFDAVGSIYLTTDENLLFHRGITHSLLFSTILCSVLYYILRIRLKKEPSEALFWVGFLLINLLTHLFIDSMNVYGVGFLEPFFDEKFSFNVMYVADPIFTLFPIISFIALLLLPIHSKKVKFWYYYALIGCLGYLGFSLYNKFTANKMLTQTLQNQGVSYGNYFTSPMPFTSLFWYGVAAEKNHYLLSHFSVFDDSLRFERYPKKKYLAQQVHKSQIENLEKFSKGFYIMKEKQDTLIFYDLRQGQIQGWRYKNAPFVFDYYLKPEVDNTLVMQRGRFKGWTLETVKAYFKRVFAWD